MEKSTLIPNNNGTVTDSKTGLVWMIPFVGQGWKNDVPDGDSISFTWHKVTAKYGSGREIKIPKEFETPYWDVRNKYKSKPELNKNCYDDYKLGKDKYEFAGFDDWRMPLVEEIFTLMETGDMNIQQIWTANSSDFYKILPNKVMNFFGLTNTYSWWANGKQIFADIHVEGQYRIKLVRLGNLFQAIH